MDKVDSTIIPKVNGDLWNVFNEIWFIKRDVTLFDNTINQQIYDLFPILVGQEWKIFNPSSGKLRNVQSMVNSAKFFFD